MDRIKTRLIIAVTNCLSAAPDTNARTELIEELSENLYQRYLDLTGSGMAEEAAYARALEELGDVDELLEYLRTLGPNGELPGEDPARPNGPSIDDIVRGAEDIVRETIYQTRDAVDQAKVIFHDVAHKLKEHYPNGFSGEFHSHRGTAMEGTTFPADELKGLDIQLINGDVKIRINPDPTADVILSGNTQRLDIRRSEDGILSVRPDKTAASTFFSVRGLVSNHVYLLLPMRHWESLLFTTVNGDVDIYDPIDTALLSVRTTSGDMDLHGVTGHVQFDSASGDADLNGSYDSVDIKTISGDVDLDGFVQTLRFTSVSGDADLRLMTPPQILEISTKSGDCDIRVPDGQGFSVNYHTVSGDLETNFSLVDSGTTRSRQAVYLDGGESTMSISSVSGDLSLRHL